MARPRDSIKICCAANYFVLKSRNLSEIAKNSQVSERTIQRWSDTAPEWEGTLDFWGYTGNRSLEMKPKRDTKRDAGALFFCARKAYQEAISSGAPRHKLAGIAAEKVGDDKLTARRVRDWARVYDWHNLPKKTDPVVIYCAAAYFTFTSRDITQIAAALKVSESTIRAWQAEHPEWTEALTVCGYDEDNAFENGSESKEKKIELAQIHGAAALSKHFTKDFKEIADIYGVSVAEVKHWAARRPEWQTSLDACGDIDKYAKVQKQPTRNAHQEQDHNTTRVQLERRRQSVFFPPPYAESKESRDQNQKAAYSRSNSERKRHRK